jgi:hypothetical protein
MLARLMPLLTLQVISTTHPTLSTLLLASAIRSPLHLAIMSHPCPFLSRAPHLPRHVSPSIPMALAIIQLNRVTAKRLCNGTLPRETEDAQAVKGVKGKRGQTQSSLVMTREKTKNECTAYLHTTILHVIITAKSKFLMGVFGVRIRADGHMIPWVSYHESIFFFLFFGLFSTNHIRNSSREG